MAQNRKILAISGSVRTGSINRKLLNLGARYLANQGFTVLIADLKQFELPIYNGDLESGQGIPENVRSLRDMVEDCQGLFVCSPEYNGSVTPLLKNMLDWTSRPFDGNPPCKAYKHKVVCLAGASEGDKGGLRGLAHLSAIFSNMGSIVVPQYFGMSFAGKAFSNNDEFIDPKISQAFEAYLGTFEALLSRW